MSSNDRLQKLLWLGLVLAGTSKLKCLRACVLGKTGQQNHSKMQAFSRGEFKVLLKVYERWTNSYQLESKFSGNMGSNELL